MTNQALPPGYQLLNYRIDKQISRGGFSIVYRANDEQGNVVAIKEYLPAALVLRSEGDIVRASSVENVTSFRYGMKCFFEEGRALARLSHPNVIRVVNFFRANETVYLVMQYERGKTLQEHLAIKRGQLRENFIRRVFTLTLNGLREVHTSKLLHLDLKPANIYVRNDNTPVLIDFGAARQTLTGAVQAQPDVHAGFRTARAVQEPGAARPVERFVQRGCGDVRMRLGVGAAAGRPARRARPLCSRGQAVRRTLYGAAARDDRLVPATRSHASPAKRVGAAKGAVA